ncbi:hypothetical protein G6F65_019522 [Rhizopus arrhizus]|nr:hypothetical protein G6F65_019522 [Rhizopus arrhizus]
MANVERKRLFIGVLVLFGVSNAVAAMAPNIWIMAVARFVPALALPVFWSLASATAVELVGPARAGRAISMVAFGIVAATVFGIPIGVLISDAFGWRAAFWVLSGHPDSRRQRQAGDAAAHPAQPDRAGPRGAVAAGVHRHVHGLHLPGGHAGAAGRLQRADRRLDHDGLRWRGPDRQHLGRPHGGP